MAVGALGVTGQDRIEYRSWSIQEGANMKMFKCTKCSATFSTRDELRRHQFGHLYPDAAKMDSATGLEDISESDERLMSAMEEVIEE